MDSQENALLQGTKEEEKNVEQSAVQVENAESQAPSAISAEPDGTEPTAESQPETKVYRAKQEVIDRLTEIVNGDENPRKDETELLKTVFYKLHNAEREARLKAYIDGGGDPDTYQITPDDSEATFKSLMAVVREKRAQAFRKQEEEKAANLEKKLDIINRIKAMATSPEEANKSYNEFKELQQQWKDIKAVPAEKSAELWRSYQLYVEQFYDLLKLNSEAREYDFRKNLELKTRLCEAAEKLAGEEDVISAFHQLQELHQQYRETGPVAKELREQIWTRFKAASTVINKRHQQHFEEIRAKEQENLDRKTALCEKVEAIAREENKTAKDWELHSQQIIEVQAEWKAIGFAPQKMNVKIFERFRQACDDFFNRKLEYHREQKKTYAANAEKKRALVEKAQALADSTAWKSTGDKLIALQKEWKTTGPVPRKLGDQLWNDFLTACNTFFAARNAANADAHNEEYANLEKKRGVIERLRTLASAAADDMQEKVQGFIEEFNAIGHVPYKEKDAVYKEFHDLVDKVYKELHITTARRRLDNFKSNLRNVAKRGEEALDNERGRLMRRYDQLRQEIQTYENNLGFLNASSKKGSLLIDEMNRKVQKLKDDFELVKQKIKAIDAENKE